MIRMTSNRLGESLIRTRSVFAIAIVSLLAILIDAILDSRGMFSLGAGTLGFLLGLFLTSFFVIETVERKYAIDSILPAAIVLLGFGLDMALLSSGDLGVAGLASILVAITVAFITTMIMGKILGIGAPQSFALGAGGAICGTSAVLAVAPSLRLDAAKTGAIVAVVNLLGLATFLSVPILSHLLGMGDQTAGIWAGSTVHAVPQAIAAGEALGGDALSLASGTKLTRVLGLLVIVPAASLFAGNKEATSTDKWSKKANIPLFLPGFILASILATTLVPTQIATELENFGSVLMVPVLVLIGSSIDVKELVGAAGPILWAGAVSTVIVMASTALTLAMLM